MHDGTNQTRVNRDRKKLTIKKTKPWSHQAELAAHAGKKIALFLVDDSHAVGILRNADQFTISVERDTNSVVTYFKGQMFGYRLLDDKVSA